MRTLEKKVTRQFNFGMKPTIKKSLDWNKVVSGLDEFGIKQFITYLDNLLYSSGHGWDLVWDTIWDRLEGNFKTRDFTRKISWKNSSNISFSKALDEE